MVRIKRVTKKASMAARKFATEVIIKKLHKELKALYKFDVRLVGSAKWNTILRIDGKMWDVDYQIILTTNSKIYKKDKMFKNPTQIKQDFFNCLNDYFKEQNGFVVQNSTTAVTVINNNSGYSFDFVIIDNMDRIIRRNNNDDTGKNIFTWNELKKYSPAYDKFESLSADAKKDLIENHILPRKIEEKRKQGNDPTKKSSYEVFIEEVNNYVARK